MTTTNTSVRLWMGMIHSETGKKKKSLAWSWANYKLHFLMQIGLCPPYHSAGIESQTEGQLIYCTLLV
jgi:hypothetical protein